MAATPQTKTIGGTVYTVTPFGARKGRTVLFQLTKLLGGAMGALAGSGGIAEAVSAWSASAREEDFTAVCSALESCTTFAVDVDGKGGVVVPMPLADVFDDHFAGRYDAMVAWLVFALETNFSSFFSGSLVAGFLPQRKASASSTAPTG
jgi:hypothetical protein